MLRDRRVLLLSVGDGLPVRYSAIVSDVDGTLLRSHDSSVSGRMVRAARAAMDRGCLFHIATGRPLGSAKLVHDEIGANGALVCFQGAMVMESSTNEILRHERLEEDVAAEAIRFFSMRDMHVRVYFATETWMNKANERSLARARRAGIRIVESSDLLSLSKLQPTVVIGMSGADEMQGHVDDANDLLGGSALVTRSLPHFCEVGARSAGKSVALQWLADRLGLDPSGFVAFGDGLGDVDMLRWAGLGVAVGTSDEAVLEVSDELVAGPKEDGVAARMEGLLDAEMV